MSFSNLAPNHPIPTASRVLGLRLDDSLERPVRPRTCAHGYGSSQKQDAEPNEQRENVLGGGESSEKHIQVVHSPLPVDTPRTRLIPLPSTWDSMLEMMPTTRTLSRAWHPKVFGTGG